MPVIISKDYLSLYNFGFATSRGMPQVSEEVIGMVPLQLSLSGNGRQQWVNARIVGFSSRLNTIAVPEEFMDWANREFSANASESPSRLITVEKSAEILVKVLSIRPDKLQTIRPQDFRDLAVDFHVMLPEEFLFEK